MRGSSQSTSLLGASSGRASAGSKAAAIPPNAPIMTFLRSLPLRSSQVAAALRRHRMTHPLYAGTFRSAPDRIRTCDLRFRRSAVAPVLRGLRLARGRAATDLRLDWELFWQNRCNECRACRTPIGAEKPLSAQMSQSVAPRQTDGGAGNRTQTLGLKGPCSTFELRPRAERNVDPRLVPEVAAGREDHRDPGLVARRDHLFVPA
jgi:hypothetical protein